MSNFGFPRLRVVNPYEVAFREARSAVGASALLASAGEYATAAEIERITAMLLDALGASGYLRKHPTSDAEERARRLVHRLNLSASDGEVWLGMLRQIVWKLRLGEKTKLQTAGDNAGSSFSKALLGKTTGK